jgi:hypothetical protein
MLRRPVQLGLVLLGLLFLGSAALADPILTIDQSNEQPGTLYQIDYYEPVGQGFRPSLEQLVSIELWLSDLNNHVGPILPFTLNLRGDSIAGSILATVDVTPAYPGGNAWIEFAFATPVVLSPGELYVIELQAASARGGWMASFSPGGTDYAEGVAYFNGVASANEDFMFRTIAIVPEPSTWTMLMIGLAARRRKGGLRR